MLCPRFNIIGFNSYQARTLLQEYGEFCQGIYDDGKVGLETANKMSVQPLCDLRYEGSAKVFNVLCVFNENSIKNIVSKLGNMELIFIEDFIVSNRLHSKVINFPSQKEILNIFQKVSGVFADVFSEDTLTSIIQYWQTGKRSRLDSICRSEDNIYFGEYFLEFNDVEVYVDVGAYNGDSFLAFQNRVSDYKEAHLFEPVEKITCVSRNVSVHSVALGDQDKQVVFKSSGLNSKMSQDGEHTVSLKTLDSFGLTPSFIKVDAEGMDIEVLRGAEFTIRRSKPKIAVSVYHHPSDLIHCYKILKKYGYSKFYLRKYQISNEETVLYAIQ